MSFQTKFQFAVTQTRGRTTIRSQPLYALTIEEICEGSGYSPPPDPVQPGSYTPKSPPCHGISQPCVGSPRLIHIQLGPELKEPQWFERRNPSWGFRSRTLGFLPTKKLLDGDLRASCFESCLCLVYIFLLALFDQGCRSSIYKILRFLQAEA